LAGINCRYQGDSKPVEKIRRLVSDGRALPVCPEQLGGLTTPRIPAQIVLGDGNDVIDGRSSVVAEDGPDVTAEFMRGALETLAIARLISADFAVFKQRSPSCGCGQICRDDTIVKGLGVAAALLGREGFEVISEEEYVLDDSKI
jgi:uncharacterized protein YbbK (DUF523 family)